ncbi:SCO2525 family SAM-dependent methyltransferase [Streptomyces sp. CO7]
MALNSEAPWDQFCPNDYVKRNYASPLDVDKKIVRLVGKHFTDHFGERRQGPVKGVDVGAGANLYPALCMLPWCSEITLLEKGPKNLDYLHGQVNGGLDTAWDAFWDELALTYDPYKAVHGERHEKLRGVAEPREGDLLQLGGSTERWGMGAMFFVAESMSSSGEEFRTAVKHFLGVLEPGAPFAAAFMLKSKGYEVGAYDYPAYSVDRDEVGKALEPLVQENVTYHELDFVLREGHEGMLLALGFRRTG